MLLAVPQDVGMLVCVLFGDQAMRLIYQPKGQAREYCPLSLNLSWQCGHGCRYCYMQQMKRFDRGRKITPEILSDLLPGQARAHKDSGRTILLCFTCDPYGPALRPGLTRQALEILAQAGAAATVLTKSGLKATADFDILAGAGFWFGSTLCWSKDKDREYWEPHAASVESRWSAIEKAHELGIRTWISTEPSIDPAQGLDVITRGIGLVDAFAVGTWNYSREASKLDYRRYLEKVLALAQENNLRLYVKDSLAVHGPVPSAYRHRLFE